MFHVCPHFLDMGYIFIVISVHQCKNYLRPCRTAMNAHYGLNILTISKPTQRFRLMMTKVSTISAFENYDKIQKT